MAEGFKLLDAYVEVKADGKGIAGKVAEDIQRESAGSRGLGRTGSTMGSHLLGGLKGAFTTGVVGGLVGGVVGGVASGLVSIVTTAVSDISSLLTTVSGMIATTVIDYNSQLESANIGFTTMLGSGAKARSFLGDLQTFAKSTPFDFGGLVHSAQNMMGMGIAAKDVIPDLRALGDAVAAAGGSAAQVDQVTAAFSQMSAKGTVDLGNMYQVINGGVSGAFDYMAAGLGVTTGKLIEMISAGDVASKVALPALVKGIEHGTKSIHGLGGMMDKQSRTFAGALSNIKDGLTGTVATAFKPFFDSASHGMQRFGAALSGKPVQRFTKDVEHAVRPLAKQIDKWLGGIDFNKIFKGASKVLKNLTKGLDPKDLGKFLKDMTADAGDIFRDLVKIAPKVIRAIKEVAPAIMATIKQVVGFVGAIADMIDWFDKVEKSWNTWRSNGIKGMELLFSGVTAIVSAGWKTVLGFFQDAANRINDLFGGLPGALRTIGGQMVAGLVGGLQDAWGGIISTLHGLAMQLPEPVRAALGIHSPSKVFHTIGKQVGQGLHQGLLGSVDEINTAADKLADAVMDDKRWKGTKLGARMVAGIRSEARKLRSLSRQRDAALDDVQADKDRLADLRSQRADYAAGVKSNVMGNAGASSIFGAAMQAQRDARQAAKDFNKDLQPTVMGAGTVTLNGSTYTPSWTTSVAGKAKAVPKVSAHAGLLELRRSLRKLLADTKHFSSNMARLAKMGIDPYTYDEIVNAGVRGGGLETSDALIKDPKLARQIFTLERQVSSAAGSLGRKTSTHRYAERIADARDELRRDQDEVKHINLTMVVEANKIDEVQRLLNMVNHVRHTARKGSTMKKGKHR